MTTQHRVPAGVPTGGQFAASVRSEPGSVTLAPGDTDDCPATGLSDPQRVAMTQGALVKATTRDSHLSRVETQAAIRQINAEAHLLLTLPDDTPIPPVDEVAPAALEHIENLPDHQRVPGNPGPMSAERAGQIADYFTARAQAVVNNHRADLDKGPTAANAYVNESLLIAARLREPAAHRYAHDALRSQMRDALLHAPIWGTVDADDRWPGQYTAHVADYEGFRLNITPGDNDSYAAPGFHWVAENGPHRYSGDAATLEEAQAEAREAADYVASGEAEADYWMGQDEAGF